MSGSSRYSALATDTDDDAAAGGGGRGVPLLLPVATKKADRVQVVAPADLPAGYELQCEFQGRSVAVQVPPEGVKQGEKFVAGVINCQGDVYGDEAANGDDDLSGHHRIPYGRWRDGICDCFANGVWHPMLWLACCCRPLALGQVMTRMNLTAMGNPIPQADDSRRGRRGERTTAFQVVACVFVLFMSVNYGLAFVYMPFSPGPPPPETAWDSIVVGVQNASALLLGAYLLALLIRARAHVRERYDIPERCCVGCEDCCCAVWLPCCATLQIARHTADYERYPAACCTDTGLPPHHRRHRPRRHQHPDDHDDENACGAPYVV